MWAWFGLAGLCLILELFSGTFYLLLVATGLAAAGIAAWLGFSYLVQLASLSIVTLLTLVILKKLGVLRKKSRRSPTSDVNVNMDIGTVVQVSEWSEINTARVFLRGANWGARLSSKIEGKPAPGAYRIVDIEGVILILAPV